MTETVSKEYLQALTEKETLVKQIYEITQRDRFLGNEDEVDRYVAFLNERQPLFDKLDTINATLKKFEGANDNTAGTDAAAIKQRIAQIIDKIVEIDKPTNAKMNALYIELGKKTGQINTSKRMANAYQNQLSQTDGYFIDSKK